MRVVVRFILPVKELSRSKRRLLVEDRVGLVVAMIQDTVAAILATDAGPVTVVSPDPKVRDLAGAMGVDFLGHGGALNEAIRDARQPGMTAAVLPDLPALTAAALLEVLALAPGFVPDTAGTGTTMAIDTDLQPVFGPGSAAAFTAGGLPALAAGPGVRCDVDTTQDLARAVGLGVGPHTSAHLARRGPARVTRTGPRMR